MGFNRKISIVFVTLFVFCFSAPIDEKMDSSNDHKYRDALENNDLFGGDILLPKNNRFGIRSFYYRWSQNTIPYLVANNLTNLRFQIEKAMRHIEIKTCIRFVKRTIEHDYVLIYSGHGCYSHVGRIGGQQDLSLGKGCEPMGIIVHELMHTIGFWHHHQRVDRDQYLKIYWKNIHNNLVNNFVKLSPVTTVVFTPFDYKSIMLYDSTAFSKDGYSKTMTAIDPHTILQPAWKKIYLSDTDAFSINKLYNCV